MLGNNSKRSYLQIFPSYALSNSLMDLLQEHDRMTMISSQYISSHNLIEIYIMFSFLFLFFSLFFFFFHLLIVIVLF